MGPILDQNRTGEGVCRRADVGRLPEIIEKSAIAKKFSPPIFSPLLPGGGGAGPKCPPVPRNRARGNATAGRTPQEGISTRRTVPPGTGGPSVFNLKTRGGREAESRKGENREPLSGVAFRLVRTGNPRHERKFFFKVADYSMLSNRYPVSKLRYSSSRGANGVRSADERTRWGKDDKHVKLG